MIRSLLSKKSVNMLTGITLGGAAALYFSRSSLRAEAPGALNPDRFMPLPLVSGRYISKDTKELVFHLPDDHVLGGKPSFMVFFRAPGEDGKPIIRPYTPISSPDTVGSATFVIKVYPEGKMSKHLHGLKEGDQVEVKGPIQKYPLQQNQHKKIALLGGGTGITPLFQVLQKIANDPNDKTVVDLYFGNNTPDDVLIKSEIDSAVAKKPNQLRVFYFAKDAPDSWKGEKGYISKDFLDKNMFKPSEENVKVFVCGPVPFYEAISGNKNSPTDQGELKGILKELGFTSDQVYKF